MLAWSHEPGEKRKEGGGRGRRVNFEDGKERGGRTSSRILRGHGEVGGVKFKLSSEREG